MGRKRTWGAGWSLLERRKLRPGKGRAHLVGTTLPCSVERCDSSGLVLFHLECNTVVFLFVAAYNLCDCRLKIVTNCSSLSFKSLFWGPTSFKNGLKSLLLDKEALAWWVFTWFCQESSLKAQFLLLSNGKRLFKLALNLWAARSVFHFAWNRTSCMLHFIWTIK